MSISARNWAWELELRPLARNERARSGFNIGTRMSHGEKLVLLYLAECENYSEGFAWPSQKTIAERCCLTDRSVRTHLSTLEQVGLIKTTKRGRSLRYALNVPDEHRSKERRSTTRTDENAEVTP